MLGHTSFSTLAHFCCFFLLFQLLFSKFTTLKDKLNSGPILIASDWELPFKLMCDVSNYAIGAILGQRKNKVFHAIYYARKTLNEA